MKLREQIEKLRKVIEACRVSSAGKEVFELAKAYASDAKYFLSKGMQAEALEAFAIAWAYIDALLHLGLAKVPQEFLDWFTVEGNKFKEKKQNLG